VCGVLPAYFLAPILILFHFLATEIPPCSKNSPCILPTVELAQGAIGRRISVGPANWIFLPFFREVSFIDPPTSLGGVVSSQPSDGVGGGWREARFPVRTVLF